MVNVNERAGTVDQVVFAKDNGAGEEANLKGLYNRSGPVDINIALPFAIHGNWGMGAYIGRLMAGAFTGF